MRTKMMSMMLAIVVLALASGAAAGSGRITLKGYLIDKLSADKFFTSHTPVGNGAYKVAEPLNEAKELTREHMLMGDAVKSGYGILFGSADKEEEWMPFDDKSNKLVRRLLLASTKTKGIRIEVTGRDTRKGFKIESIKEIE